MAMPVLSRPALWFSGVVLWFCVLFYLSSRKMPEIPGPEIPYMDKILHCVYFAGGATCVFLGVRLKHPEKKATFAFGMAVLFAAVVGVTDEFHQTFVPGRMGGDPYDWLADVAGGFVGSGIGALIHGWVKAKTLVAEKVRR